jgi:ABC-type branched-subunit amino acid transport system ATPase component
MTADVSDEAEVPVLESRDVAVHFGGVKAVDGVSIALTEGKIFGIVGPNGSGKTTLLGAITRLTALTRGDLLLDGRSYARAAPHEVGRRRIARTFQTVRLLSGRTVSDNVALAGDIPRPGLRRTRDQKRSDIDDAIERTGIRSLLKSYPDELSYGSQRRVEIARALAAGPRLLLLDEPTAGMNPRERESIARLLKKLRGEGLTQLLIEHDVQMMLDTCDHLYAMNFGRLIASGAPSDVVRDSDVQKAYLGRRSAQRNARDH